MTHTQKFMGMVANLFGNQATPPPVAAIPKPSEPIKTVHDFAAQIRERRGQPEPVAAKVVQQINPLESLTACLDSADCPATARRIFRTLHHLALLSVRALGLPHRPSVAVFHLPLELLASHLEVDRVTVWRNLQPLLARGLVDTKDHYDTLTGMTAITGKLWAVSLVPERVLSGLADPVKLRHADMVYPWRDLGRDVQEGRTAYALTRTEERQAAEKAVREAQAEQRAKAFERASKRRQDRDRAKRRGETVLTGRAAATANAAQTRAEKPRPTRPTRKVQQSREGLKAVGRAELQKWVLAPFSTSSDDSVLIVAGRISDGLDAIFSLPSLADVPKAQRNQTVEETARALARAFEDTQNLKFWCWLVWQLLRGTAQGHAYMDDVSHILARVLHDIKHDETCYNRSVVKPAALVAKELNAVGLLDALRELKRYRVGSYPKN